MRKGDSVLLLSGGVDSAVCLALELKADRRVVPLFFNYGQPQFESELIAFNGLVNHYGLLDEIRTWNTPNLGHSGSFDYPMRNVIFLAYAVNLAATLGIKRVVSGIRESGYADTTSLFVDVFAGMARNLSDGKINLEFPIFWLDKKNVIARGKSLELPFNLTHSCFRGNEPCGECATCKEIKEEVSILEA